MIKKQKNHLTAIKNNTTNINNKIIIINNYLLRIERVKQKYKMNLKNKKYAINKIL